MTNQSVTQQNETIIINQSPSTKNAPYNYSIWRRWCSRVIDTFTQYNLILISLLAAYFINFTFKDNSTIVFYNNLAVLILIILVIFLYIPLMVKVFRQTPGQKIVGLQYNTNNGNNPEFWRILLRELSNLIPLSELISLITILNSNNKKSLYDYICRTTVIKYKQTKLFFLKWLVTIILLISSIIGICIFAFQYMNTHRIPSKFESIEVNKTEGYEILKKNAGNPFGKNWERADNAFVIIQGEQSQEKKDVIAKKIPITQEYTMINYYKPESNIRSILEIDGDTSLATEYIDSQISIAEIVYSK
jgi:uncharacterized RDD family membrane protein YckC